MLEEKRLKQIVKQVLSYSKTDQTEVIIYTVDFSLTRFANSYIHQNIHSNDVFIQVRIIDDKRIGVASTNSIDTQSLHNVVLRAEKIAKLNKEDPSFVSLPKPQPIRKVSSFSKKTTQFGSMNRARAIKKVIEQASKSKLTAFGAYQVITSEMGVGNSLGVWAYQPGTEAVLSTVVMGLTSSGFASEMSVDVSNIDPVRVAKKAIDKAFLGQKPIKIDPGDYDVILEAPAVAEMMDFFSYLGPNARIFHEEASYLRDKLGKRVFSENLTIIDDPLNLDLSPRAFDAEGYPKQKTPLIVKGVPKAVVYDSYWANKHKKKNTGHALPAPNTDGPMPGHLVFKPGKMKTEQLIKMVKKGILVTRFWYVRVLHHYQMNITGMTRDGTFLIENGKIVGGIKNLRFTQSIPLALKNVKAVSRDLSLEQSWVGTGLFPTLYIKNFNFTSTTEF